MRQELGGWRAVKRPCWQHHRAQVKLTRGSRAAAWARADVQGTHVEPEDAVVHEVLHSAGCAHHHLHASSACLDLQQAAQPAAQRESVRAPDRQGRGEEAVG